jgi:hypothetical protein
MSGKLGRGRLLVWLAIFTVALGVLGWTGLSRLRPYLTVWGILPGEAPNWSQPLDPWSIKPVPVDQIWLVLPARRASDGLIDQEGIQLAFLTNAAIESVMPRSLALIPSNWTIPQISAMMDYRGDDLMELTEQAENDLVRHAGATHTIAMTYAHQGDSTIVGIQLMTPGGARTTSITVPRQHDVEAARQAALYLIRESGLAIDAVRRARLEAGVPGGPGWESTHQGIRAEARKDPHHPAWEPGGKPRDPFTEPELFLLRVRSAIEAKDYPLLTKLDPGPLPKGSQVPLRMARSYLLVTIQQNEEALHEARLLMAEYPGELTNRLRLNTPGLTWFQKDDRLWADFERWAARMPSLPIVRLAQADGALTIASAARGTGWASEVSREDMASWRRYNTLAGRIAAEVLTETGPFPPTSQTMVAAAFRDGDPELALEQHRKLLAKYPDSAATWGLVSTFLMPRWYGRGDQGGLLLDAAMAERPRNARLARFVYDLYYLDIYRSHYSNARWLEFVADWAAANPVQGARLWRAYEIAMQENVRPEERGEAAFIASMLRDHVRRRAAVEADPRVWRHIRWILSDMSAGRAELEVLEDLVALGEWEEYTEAIKVFKEWEVERRKQGMDPAFLTFGSSTMEDFMERLGRVMQEGDPADLQELSIAAPSDPPFAYYYAVALIGTGSEIDQRAIDLLVKESNAVDPDSQRLGASYHILHAMLLARTGMEEKAREAWGHWRAASGVPGIPWIEAIALREIPGIE